MSYKPPTAVAGISEPLHWWDLDDQGVWANDGNGTPIPLLEVAGKEPFVVAGDGPNGQDWMDTNLRYQYLYSIGADMGGTGDDWSVATWCKLSLIGQGGLIGYLGMFNIELDSTDNWEITIYDSLGTTHTAWEPSWTRVTNHVHIALVWDSTAKLAKFYINGTNVSNKSLPTHGSPDRTNRDFVIGSIVYNRSGTGSYWRGRMGMTGIWDSVLSTDDIGELYNGSLGAQYAELWP